VATGRLRDLDDLRLGLSAWLAGPQSVVPDAEVRAVSRASAGYSNESLVVDVDGPRGRERLVVRLPTLEPSLPDYDLPMQAVVHAVLATAGIPVPDPVTVVDDPSWVGTPFVVMPFIEGHVLGEVPALDRWLTERPVVEQRLVHDRFIQLLARVHRVDWSTTSAAGVVRGGGRCLTDELEWWRRYAERTSTDVPFLPLVEGLDWCRHHCPSNEPPASLLWGDPRLGNVIVDDDCRVVAALDWDLASIGPAEMDLAWYLVLDDVTTSALGSSVPGFPEHEETIGNYEEQLGRRLVDYRWHEVFAVCRALAISNCQARIAGAAGEPYVSPADEGNPLVGVLGRRIAAFG